MERVNFGHSPTHTIVLSSPEKHTARVTCKSQHEIRRQARLRASENVADESRVGDGDVERAGEALDAVARGGTGRRASLRMPDRENKP